MRSSLTRRGWERLSNEGHGFSPVPFVGRFIPEALRVRENLL
jgi:hypothetical protein